MAAIEAIVLAAGTASRMGGGKLLLDLDGATIIEKVIGIIKAAGLEKITIITGHNADGLVKAIDDQRVRFIHNPDYRQGMSTSLKTAVRQVVQERAADAVVFFNGDMPFIQADTVKKILEKYEETGAAIIVPSCDGRRGHPVLFSREIFAELLTVDGDVGARQILARHQERVLTVCVTDPGIHIDIDDGEDYLQALQRCGSDLE